MELGPKNRYEKKNIHKHTFITCVCTRLTVEGMHVRELGNKRERKTGGLPPDRRIRS